MTEHFSLAELTASNVARAKGIDNTPPADVLPHLQRTAEGLERVRALIGQPIQVLSGYRCPALNVEVGGSKNSQHMAGQAADIQAPAFGSIHKLAETIAANAKALGVDQVIKERNSRGAEWVHVSFTVKPRHMALTLTMAGMVSGIV